MKRLLFLVGLLTAAWAGPAYAADGIPPRPKPFTFVTDQAGLLQPAEVKRLDYGLRQYADNNGTQVVVVTVPSLGGQEVNAFARQLGTDWGIGQKDKNNGLVVLVAKQEHKLSIEPGAGLRDRVTPSVIQRAIGQMTPQFKQNDYGQGLRNGLNVLLAAANPGSAPKNTASATTAPATSGAVANSSSLGTTTSPSAAQAMGDPAGATQSEAAPTSGGGIGLSTILIGVVVVGGGIWLLSRLFRRNANAAGNNGPGGTPNFYPNQPTQGGTPNFYPNQGPGYGAPQQSGGSGMGSILATGAAAAAGAYLGNRLGGSHDSNEGGRNFSSDNLSNNAGTAAGTAGGTAAADDYFSSRGGAEESNASPDYFSNSGDDSSGGDFFSGNDSSYDDSSGGGGFDDTNNDNSGSW
ncbi:TPM domain-containing protein [Hymenobacter sp. RP-2-7]|uniref:TPM domain-containing protein n=1 Tax=Hymenobacter polaris TaxID=2682546 RepID=A0A7Y0AEZ2_9BACT|nr:TPM domain-containing protein [Hymenobacter polaris]NML66115.1 TPM domain-containing protein [Hymenobacter polaris]